MLGKRYIDTRHSGYWWNVELYEVSIIVKPHTINLSYIIAPPVAPFTNMV